jgi:2-phospho-L-lactate transferase/gluconeogenesis factor (CofD/UPF0052 family)
MTAAAATTGTTPAPKRVKAEKERVRVVLFSGGSGTKSISDAMAWHPQISLTVLINCYDDGLSTGRLRRFIPGMLGPSDVRKNIARLMPKGEKCFDALRFLSDHRLPVGVDRAEAWNLIEDLAEQRLDRLPPPIASRWIELTVQQDRSLRSYCRSFLEYGKVEAAAGRHFDFTDCALGNIYFAGCYLGEGRDFNRAVDAFCRFYQTEGELLNLTQGENLFLIAEKDDGSFFLSEADLVSAPAKIRGIYLVSQEEYLSRLERAEDLRLTNQEIRELVASSACTPKLNPAAAEALRQADVIVYGPGTQHSSLLPSYLTEGVGRLVVENKSADKVFVANIRRDVDIERDDANDLADKLLDSMRRSGVEKVEWRDCVTHFFVQQKMEDGQTGYVPFDDKTFRYPLDTVRARDWEAHEGKHDGGYVFDELKQIIQSRIDISLAPKPHTVSIVVPALNERPTVEQTLISLSALDFSKQGLSKEIIFVDGGSTDGTLEAASAIRGIKVLQLPNDGRKGRGAALRTGIDAARGNFIVFYPADKEYKTEDVHRIVSQLLENRHSAVFGIRTAKVMDLSAHLKRIYKGHPVLYVVSKYGGLAISILALVLFNRYFSDILTSLKGFDANVLRSLALRSDSVDLDAEIVAKLCKQQNYVLEVPVDFVPRTRAEGKKITSMDGLKAVYALIKYRLGSR